MPCHTSVSLKVNKNTKHKANMLVFFLLVQYRIRQDVLKHVVHDIYYTDYKNLYTTEFIYGGKQKFAVYVT